MNGWGKWILLALGAVVVVFWLIAEAQKRDLKARHELDRKQVEFDTKLENLNRRAKNMKPGDI